VVEDIGVAGVVKTERCLAKGWEVAGWEASLVGTAGVKAVGAESVVVIGCRRGRLRAVGRLTRVVGAVKGGTSAVEGMSSCHASEGKIKLQNHRRETISLDPSCRDGEREGKTDLHLNSEDLVGHVGGRAGDPVVEHLHLVRSELPAHRRESLRLISLAREVVLGEGGGDVILDGGRVVKGSEGGLGLVLDVDERGVSLAFDPDDGLLHPDILAWASACARSVSMSSVRNKKGRDKQEQKVKR
jgi:hypothetical protein